MGTLSTDREFEFDEVATMAPPPVPVAHADAHGAGLVVHATWLMWLMWLLADSVVDTHADPAPPQLAEAPVDPLPVVMQVMPAPSGHATPWSIADAPP